MGFNDLDASLDRHRVDEDHDQGRAGEDRQILVKIDFKNGDPMHFFKHLAKAMAL